MELPSNISGINNLKLVKDYDKLVKNLIKQDNHKITAINIYIEETEKIINKNERERELWNNKIKKSFPFVCEKCQLRFKKKNILNSHGCKNINGIRTINFTRQGVLLKDTSPTTYRLKRSIDSKNRELKNINVEIRRLENLKKDIKFKIDFLLVRCSNCNKNNKVLEELNCKYNHSVCVECLDDITNDNSNKLMNCPTCNQIIKMEMCPICMSFKKKLIDVSCGNEHLICISCFENILNNSGTCPFCRGRI